MQMSFFEELKRRNVFRVGIAYVIAAWILLQLTDVLVELLGLPDTAGKFVVLLLVIGFVPAVIFAWAFEMTPDGIKLEKDVDRSESITHKTGRKLDYTIIGVLIIVAGYFIWESRFQNAPDISAEATVISANTPVIPAKAGTSAENQTAQTTASKPRNPNSIAVLPFANRSNQENDMFFTDGIHDDLLTQLAKIKGLKVISRTSVMKYKNTTKTIPEIAAELQVSNILEGGIQRAGKRIRINAQLIDVANDQHLWAETFDREMTVENIFDIQSEIARHIVQAVRGEMTEAEVLNLARIPTSNLQAYESYLQALALTNRSDYSQENYIEAEVWARRAVELDPEFSQAWAMLVEIHAQATWIGYDASPERFALVKEALDNAIRYGPDLAETIAAKAEYQYRVENKYKQSVVTFKQALMLLPGDADIIHRLAVAERRAGYMEDAVASFARALELDPGHSRSPTTMVETLLQMNEIERATKLIDQFMLRYPDARDLRSSKVQSYINRGDLDSARMLMDSMQPWVSSSYFVTATLLPLLERDYKGLREIFELPEIAISTGNRGFTGNEQTMLAWSYYLSGDIEQAGVHARNSIELLTSLEPTGSYIDAFERSTLAVAYALIGENEKAVAAAHESVRLMPESKDPMFGTDVSETRAMILGMTGHREEALAEIERLLIVPTGFNRWMLYLDPRWDFFRDDERFNELARPLDLPEAKQ